MMKKTFEILQDRDVRYPWCLFVTLNKHYQKITAKCEVVAEWIPEKSLTFKVDNIKGNHSDNSVFIDELSGICLKYSHPLTIADIEQINNRLNKAKQIMSIRKKK